MITGASARNWSAYGHEVALADELTLVDRHLLTDPQTSGGLLVACSAEAVPDVLAVFQQHGFAEAAEIGSMAPTTGTGIHLRVR